MQKLSDSMPGLNQMLTPTTTTAAVAPTPTIGLSATSFSFTSVQSGSNPSAQTLMISNTGAGTLSWTISENAAWLTPSVLSGTGAGSVTLAINTSGMAAGTYTAPLTVAATVVILAP